MIRRWSAARQREQGTEFRIADIRAGGRTGAPGSRTFLSAATVPSAFTVPAVCDAAPSES